MIMYYHTCPFGFTQLATSSCDINLLQVVSDCGEAYQQICNTQLQFNLMQKHLWCKKDVAK